MTAVLLCAAPRIALAQVGAPNGNDFALYFSECRTGADRNALLDEAGRRPHYFRYLKILEMEAEENGPRTSVHITAIEPASLYDVTFKIDQPVSLSILRKEPASVRGQAIAVSGVIQRADPEKRTLHLDPVVVRHKDRLAPKTGVEMLYDIDDSAIFYSYTGGREPVSVGYRDRDLLRHRDRILQDEGPQAWADFLTRETAARNAARKDSP